MSNKILWTAGLGKKEASSSLRFYHFNMTEQRTKSTAAESTVISVQLSESTTFPGFLAVH